MCGAVSTSLWWDNANFLRQTMVNSSWVRGHKIYLDIGMSEGTPHDSAIYVALTRQMEATLMQAGLSLGTDLKYYEAIGADHSETSWAMRVGPMLEFFFGKNQ